MPHCSQFSIYCVPLYTLTVEFCNPSIIRLFHRLYRYLVSMELTIYRVNLYGELRQRSGYKEGGNSSCPRVHRDFELTQFDRYSSRGLEQG